LSLLVLALALVAGCGGDDDSGDGGETGSTTAPAETQAETTPQEPAGAPGCKEVALPAAKVPRAEKPDAELPAAEDVAVTFRTNCGKFTVDVDEERGLTAASFVKLADEGVYDDTFFHRIAPNFVIQGGDPEGTGIGGPGYTTEDAPPQDTKYVTGTVAMAKASAEPPGTAGSQFFVVLSPAGGDMLTPDYAVVGKVSAGMDVVKRIGELGDALERPTHVVKVTKTTVTRGG
jgi:peptidyl-prolyl cis-trans isomerase B (cyclophilin B)